MKRNLVLEIIAALTMASSAQAGLIDRGCYIEQSKDFGSYLVDISIYDDSVRVIYVSRTHGILGNYSGDILRSSGLKETKQAISIQNINLNDGHDGYLTGMAIQMTKSSISFGRAQDVVKAKVRVGCIMRD